MFSYPPASFEPDFSNVDLSTRLIAAVIGKLSLLFPPKKVFKHGAGVDKETFSPRLRGQKVPLRDMGWTRQIQMGLRLADSLRQPLRW